MDYQRILILLESHQCIFMEQWDILSGKFVYCNLHPLHGQTFPKQIIRQWFRCRFQMCAFFNTKTNVVVSEYMH